MGHLVLYTSNTEVAVSSGQQTSPTAFSFQTSLLTSQPHPNPHSDLLSLKPARRSLPFPVLSTSKREPHGSFISPINLLLFAQFSDSLVSSLMFSFYHVGPRDQTQVIRPGGKGFNLLNHLARAQLILTTSQSSVATFLSLWEKGLTSELNENPSENEVLGNLRSAGPK